ncbi:hypothetical protein [Sphingomonas guangdongensis]|uniref:hypothetical protein n=1 Tax=Sphingomonas guangdongensis TaxID=1141890 RepID=UPI0011818823|nr:hypothetical protein [Sphingomonas guangdongensis]
MPRIALLAATCLVAASPAAIAQELSPALDPVQVGQGLVLKHMVESHGRAAAAARTGKRQPTAQQVAACGQRKRFIAEHGADDPRIRKLQQLCRGVGL